MLSTQLTLILNLYQVDVAQVYTVLLSIDSTKAAGCDHIPTNLIKDDASELATPLISLITAA